MKAACFYPGPPIYCVIPFSRSDTIQAVELLEWIIELGGCKRHPCLLVTANNVWPDDKKRVEELAAKAFESVKHTSPLRPLPDEKWPRGANWLFKHAAEWMEANGKRPFWWNEPDCIPLFEDWLDYLDYEYYSIKKPFLGTAGAKVVAEGKTFGPMVNGGCLYPANAASRFAAFDYTSSEPWDVWMSPRILLETHNSKLVQHFFGQMGLPPTFARAHVKGEPENVFTLEQVRPGAVVFHRNKDGTLIKLLRSKATAPEPERPNLTFYHSGDLGDVLYSLPVVKALGGGTFYLGPHNRTGMRTRETMTKPRADVILPLLATQEYIRGAEYKVSSVKVTHDLNDFRLELCRGQLLDCRQGYNLARVPLHHWKLPLELDREPWLKAPEPIRVARVVIARSERYHAPDFNWRRVLSLYAGNIVFVGLSYEHRAFCAKFGPVPYHPTANFLDLANVIAGCDLFIGNQSSPFAIAVGLGKAAVLEECPSVTNCRFDRPNITIGSVNLPSMKPSGIYINAPVENFTGYGQLVNALCEWMANKGVSFSVNAFCFDESRVPVSTEVKKRLIKSPTQDLLICSVIEVDFRLRGGEVLLTMWESTRLDRKYVDAINRHAVCVIVPTQWNKECFEASGVKVPIRVVNLGIDPSVYNPRPWKDARIFRFGTAGRLAHAGARKGVEETVSWFREAFSMEPDVQLHVKVFDDCPLPGVEDRRVIYQRKFLPQDQLLAWYEMLHCFISTTKGEGWGLHIHQAMAIGRPVIVPRQGGQSEFVTNENAFCCNFQMATPDWGPYKDAGEWCLCDKADCIRLMRLVYSNRALAQQVSQVAARDAAKYTWENMTNGVIQVLREFGKL